MSKATKRGMMLAERIAEAPLNQSEETVTLCHVKNTAEGVLRDLCAENEAQAKRIGELEDRITFYQHQDGCWLWYDGEQIKDSACPICRKVLGEGGGDE